VDWIGSRHEDGREEPDEEPSHWYNDSVAFPGSDCEESTDCEVQDLSLQMSLRDLAVKREEECTISLHVAHVAPQEPLEDTSSASRLEASFMDRSTSSPLPGSVVETDIKSGREQAAEEARMKAAAEETEKVKTDDTIALSKATIDAMPEGPAKDLLNQQLSMIESRSTSPLKSCSFSPDEERENVVSDATHSAEVELMSIEKLQQLWCEQEFLLRKPVNSNTDIQDVMRIAREGLSFLKEIEAAAQELGLLRGAVSRAVLPFNTETSVADQADSAEKLSDGAFGIGAKLGAKRWKKMVKDATATRSLVRVKIADDADLDQAKQALTATLDFFEGLVKKSQNEGQDPHTFLSGPVSQF